MPLLLKVDAIQKKNEPPTNNILTFTEIKGDQITTNAYQPK